MRLPSFLLAVPLLAASAAWCQANLDGDWVAVIKFFDLRDYRRMTLQAQGDQITGSAGDMKITGTIHNGRLELHGRNEHGATVDMTGVIEGGAMSGKAKFHGEEVEWTAERPITRPAGAPHEHTFQPHEFHRMFSGSIPAALHIYPGDTVKTWSVDAGGRDAHNVRRSMGGNPETGPFYIEGAYPGDTLVVKLTRLRLNRDSAMSSAGIAASALSPYYFKDQKMPANYDSNWALDRARGVARPAHPTEKLKDYTVPLRPMLGCVGVAPPGHMAVASGFLGPFGGNMDYNQVREGITLYLPVFQPGALLFMGDGHAAQGDGELTGNALETSMDIEFTVDVIPGKSPGGPRAENEESLMAMGIGGSLNEALQESTTGMSQWLADRYGLNPAEISSVLGTAMRYDIAEVVDPYVNIVARVSKQALAPLRKTR